MTLKELWEQFRYTIDDYPEGRGAGDPGWEDDDSDLLWKNPEIVSYWNTTKRELCHRMPIVDRDTAEDSESTPVDLCEIDLVQGQNRYPISRRILQVRNVRRSIDDQVLRKRSLNYMDATHLGWQNQAQDHPREYLEDWSAYDLYIWPPPKDDSEKLLLTVGRLPLVRDTWDDRANEITDLPVLAENFDDALVYGMMSLAFEKRDSDTFNPDASARYDALFTERIGPRRTLEQLRAEQLGSNHIRTALSRQL